MSDLLRGVLWDLDGTLIDSGELHWVTWRDALANEGFELSREAFNERFGQRNDRFLRTLLDPDLSQEKIDRISGAKESAYRAMVRSDGITILPGALHWLETLQAQGWRQAIASSAPRQNIEVIMEVVGFDQYAAVYVGSEDVQHGKPDPEVFLVAAERIGVPPDRCIVVEDSPAGIQAGRDGGMRTIAVLTTHDQMEGDIVTASLDALAPDIFERLLTGTP
ncbi:MAG: HAD-IA family hydrolase [Chloroflexaceae bacterium]|nr:HAD-IA family hydrolase [Chloroflexaceae bacterium]NJL33904.1 HAD-IA family hydrolase [Chloroflexaceae bacterium]NJO07645.1 HAD-IA family hydrolase [Chloroflexaceae bacterium]